MVVSTRPAGRPRNAIGYAVSDWLTHPITRVVAEYRARWKLPPLASPDDSFFGARADIPDASRIRLSAGRAPAHFHYVGPLRRAAPRAIEFPWEKLDGRPSYMRRWGRCKTAREGVFRCFAEACTDFDVQLVISHGGGLTDAQASGLPGAPLVVPYAPQETLLERAHLTLTHAGLNTVLDSLAHGVPLVAVPITYEQPSIARRLEWHACGESISLGQLNVNGRVLEWQACCMIVVTEMARSG